MNNTHYDLEHARHEHIQAAPAEPDDYPDFYFEFAGGGRLHIDWQKGTVLSDQNGVDPQDVLRVVLGRLQYLDGRLLSRENSIAITNIQQAIMWLDERTRDRTSRGVEGTETQ